MLPVYSPLQSDAVEVLVNLNPISRSVSCWDVRKALFLFFLKRH